MCTDGIVRAILQVRVVPSNIGLRISTYFVTFLKYESGKLMTPHPMLFGSSRGSDLSLASYLFSLVSKARYHYIPGVSHLYEIEVIGKHDWGLLKGTLPYAMTKDIRSNNVTCFTVLVAQKVD